MSQEPAPDPTLTALEQERRRLQELVGRIPSLAGTVACLERLEREIARPLRLGILGEFNAGKTSLANLIVGIDSLPTSVVSNTLIPTVIGYAPRAVVVAVMRDGRRIEAGLLDPSERDQIRRLEAGLPAPRLVGLEIIDLPGLADPLLPAVEPADVGLTVDFAIWCTVASQAWKESERWAWTALPARLRARSLLVVTHADHLTSDADRMAVLARLKAEAGPGFRDVAMIATLDALAERSTPVDTARSTASAFDRALESARLAVAAERDVRIRRLVARVARRAFGRL